MYHELFNLVSELCAIEKVFNGYRGRQIKNATYLSGLYIL